MSGDQKNDPLAVIDAMQPWLEEMRGLVAVLVADGFSDEQARDLVVAAYRMLARGAS